MTKASARAVAAALCLLTRPDAAAQEHPAALRLEGAVRTTAAASMNYDNPLVFDDHGTDGFFQTALRLMASGKPAEALAFEVHAVQTVTLDTVAGAPAVNPALPGRGPGFRRFTATDASWSWLEGDDARAELFLDRANVRLALGPADLTVGRQAINFGRAWFWNPLDLFLPLDSWTIDRDYRAGVDAVRLDVALGSFSGVTLAGVPGRPRERGAVSWEESSLLGRAFASARGWDVALQGGRIPGGFLAGGSVGAEAAGVAIRAEAARTWADRAAVTAIDHWAAVLGAAGRLSGAVVVEAEYLYNGAGDPADLPASLGRLLAGNSLQLGRHLAGVVVWVQITPPVKGSMTWIRSLSDSSELLRANLSVRLSDEVDLQAGVFVPRGARPAGLVPRSEFGSYPGLAYLEVRHSF